MRRFFRIIFIHGFIALSLCSFFITPAYGDILGDLLVTVTEQPYDKPLEGVQVMMQDTEKNVLPLISFTNREGIVIFHGLPIGGYTVEAKKEGWIPEMASVVIQENSVSEIFLDLTKPGKAVGVYVKAKRILVNSKDPNGSSSYKNRRFMEKQMASDHTLQGVVNLTAGVTLDSQGLLHFRGEHRSMGLAIDGVLLPIPLQSQIGSLVDPRFLEEVEVRTGSYDSTFSGQLGGVLNLVARRGGTVSKASLEPEVGDHGTLGMMGYASGSSPNHKFGYYFGIQTHHTQLRIEPPTPNQQQLNNQGDDTNSLVHLNFDDAKDKLNLTLATQNLRLNLPNTPIAENAGVRQWQRENNVLGVFSWRREWSPDTQMLLGFSFLSSHQGVGNNGIFTPWILANPITMPHANQQGLPQNPEDPGSPFLPSLSRTGSQKLATLAFTHQFSEKHSLRFGGTANFIHLQDDLNILDAGGAGTLPNRTGRYTASDRRDGFNGGVFIGDFISLTPRLTGNFGVRLDRYHNGVNVKTMQISPLLNFVYAFSPAESIRWSYNRLFSAPPLEPDPTGSTRVVPQKTTAYELSYENQLDKNLVLRVGGYLKNYRDALDLALLIPLSNLPVFVPDNFPKGQTVGSELSLHTDQAKGLNWFFNFSGTSMHILEPQSGTTEIPLVDHFENVLLTSGVSYEWQNGFYLSFDQKYGSGYPQDAIKTYNEDHISPFGIHGTTSRLIGNVNLGWKPYDGIGGSLQIFNLFNTHRVINFLSNFSGTRFVKERQIVLNLFLRF